MNPGRPVKRLALCIATPLLFPETTEVEVGGPPVLVPEEVPCREVFVVSTDPSVVDVLELPSEMETLVFEVDPFVVHNRCGIPLGSKVTAVPVKVEGLAEQMGIRGHPMKLDTVVLWQAVGDVYEVNGRGGLNETMSWLVVV